MVSGGGWLLRKEKKNLESWVFWKNFLLVVQECSSIFASAENEESNREKRENRMKREKISVRNELQKKLENLYLVAPVLFF